LPLSRVTSAYLTAPDKEAIMLRNCVVAAMITCLALPACAPQVQDSAKSTGEDLMRGWVELWNSGDLSQVDILYAEDAVSEDVAEGVEYRGLVEIQRSLADDFSAVPDVKVEIVSLFASESRGAVEWIWSGTHTEDYPGLISATGKSFSVRGVSLYEFENGKIKRQHDYYDAAGFLYQLGVEFVFPEG
jgi:steroid delta-isomerase-like uncharacterized protein